MGSSLFEENDSINLPEVLLGPISYSIGYANQQLRPAERLAIVEHDEIRTSPKVKERCVRLENGERIVITKRSKLVPPNGVNGILRLTDSGQNYWLSHNLITEAISQGLSIKASIANSSWRDKLRYVAEKSPICTNADKGLRPPQLGALFAIGAHWSLSQSPATIVMPTGTGKTETMLAVLAAHQLKRVLVAVPSRALRMQTARKFIDFGLLRQLNVLEPSAFNPVVGVALKRPKNLSDLKLFNDCNVVVGIPSSLADGTALNFIDKFPEIFDTLIVDEAHHVPADTWARLKLAFKDRKILQFTATPFRNDNKLVDGTVVYSYPLSAAQKDAYFTKINFEPIYELDDRLADAAIAKAAIAKLKTDISNGYDHLLMVRCKSLERAAAVFEEYKKVAKKFNPILVHSEIADADSRIEKLTNRSSRIVVCVNMLGEGVDIPALKIAAVHDTHQSLAILLQFVGRFTRTGEKRLGEASVIANIANPKVNTSLEQLYDQDADWNKLLREFSSEAALEHAQFIRFLEESTPFESGGEESEEVSKQSLRPIFSTLFYQCEKFNPKSIYKGLSNRFTPAKVWLNRSSNTLYFVTQSSNHVKWTRSKVLQDVEWHLFVLHHDPNTKLLYLASTCKDAHFEELAAAVGASNKLSGEMMFRSLGRIGRLVFNNLGVTKHGRRNLSFAMYTGADVKQALSETEKQGSRKSNISGYGWENGQQITIGCSYKGRVWSKAAGTIPKFIAWAESVGAKLINSSIDTKSVIANVLIPSYAILLPEFDVLSLDWPVELLAHAEERVSVMDGTREHEIFMLDPVFNGIDRVKSQIDFALLSGEDRTTIAEFRLTVNGQSGFEITQIKGNALKLRIGKNDQEFTSFLRNYPPLVRFVDLSELDGNILLKADNSGVVEVPIDRLQPWDWTGVDITKESIWKNGVERQDSIQWHVAQRYMAEKFSLVFDDDGSGEAADLICIKQTEKQIKLRLVHCKFSGASSDGMRVKDVVEVASQAVRSARYPGKFTALLRHIRNRDQRRSMNRSLFLAGTRSDLTLIERASRFKEVCTEIIIVQPGLSKSNLTMDQSIVLGAAVSFVKQTLGIDLEIVCSK